MDKQQINHKIDSMASEAKETVELFSEKLDQATQCVSATGDKISNSVRKGAVKAADKVEQAVSSAANRVREKATK